MRNLTKIIFFCFFLFFILGVAGPVFALEVNYPDFLGIKADMGLPALILALFKLGLALSGFAALAMFIWAGAEWMVSGAKPALLEDAKDKMKHAALGILILAGSYIFLQTINPDFTRISIGLQSGEDLRRAQQEIERTRDQLQNVNVPTFNLQRDSSPMPENGIALYKDMGGGGDKIAVALDQSETVKRLGNLTNITVLKAPDYQPYPTAQNFDNKARSLKTAENTGVILFEGMDLNTNRQDFEDGDNAGCWFYDSDASGFGFLDKEVSSFMIMKTLGTFTVSEGDVVLYDSQKNRRNQGWRYDITGQGGPGSLVEILPPQYNNAASSISVAANYIALLYNDNPSGTGRCNVFPEGNYDIKRFPLSDWVSSVQIIKIP